jgi:hypothetical protein
MSANLSERTNLVDVVSGERPVGAPPACEQAYSRGREREGIGFACTGPIDGSIFRLQ